jgi:hypothetical protein
MTGTDECRCPSCGSTDLVEIQTAAIEAELLA